MLRLSKSEITCRTANIRAVGPNPTVFLVLETCVTSETMADFSVNQPYKRLSLPSRWLCSTGESWSFPGASRFYTSLRLKWGEDSWDLRGSSDIVLAKSAACARPNHRMCTKREITRDCVAWPKQIWSHDRHSQMKREAFDTARNGHWKILSRLLLVWDSGLEFVCFPTLKPPRIDCGRLLVLKSIGRDEKGFCTL